MLKLQHSAEVFVITTTSRLCFFRYSLNKDVEELCFSKEMH